MAQVFTDVQTLNYHVVSCYTCGVSFGIESALYRRAILDKQGWVYCPACGSKNCWNGETETEKENKRLRADLESEKDRREWVQRHATKLAYQLAAQKGMVTKLRKRINNGNEKD